MVLQIWYNFCRQVSLNTLFKLQNFNLKIRIEKKITKKIFFSILDLTPYEIKTRGLDAVNNFHSACLTGGSKAIYKTRLIIVGQEGTFTII